MKNFSLEPVIVLIVFILIPLVNYVLARMRRRFEPPKPTVRRIPDTGLRRQAAPEPRRTSQVQSGLGQGATANRVLPPTQEPSRKRLFRTPGDVRQVIIAMAVLGRCRASDLAS
jgi:hypothetical protein